MRSISRESAVEIAVAYDEERVRLTISDDGPGFPPDVLGQIGEPFLTRRTGAEQAGAGGLGLGLFIAKTLIERSGAYAALCQSGRRVAAARPSGSPGRATRWTSSAQKRLYRRCRKRNKQGGPGTGGCRCGLERRRGCPKGCAGAAATDREMEGRAVRRGVDLSQGLWQGSPKHERTMENMEMSVDESEVQPPAKPQTMDPDPTRPC